MTRLKHFSVGIFFGAQILTGCIKKSPPAKVPSEDASQPGSPAESRDLAGHEGQNLAPTLTIPDALTGLPSIGSWRPMRRDGAPSPCPGGTKVFWTGSGLLVYGQLKPTATTPVCHGLLSLWDSATDTWRALPEPTPAPLAHEAPENTEVFLLGSKLYVLAPKAGDSRIFDLTTSAWTQAPDWLAQALWAAPEPNSSPSPRPTPAAIAGTVSSDLGGTPPERILRAYIPTPTGLAVWMEPTLKVLDWQTATAKDLPPVAWPPTAGAVQNTQGNGYELRLGGTDQSLLVMRETSSQSSPSASTILLAAASLQAAPATWRMIPYPVLVDDQGKPKCTDPVPAFASLNENKVILLGIDNTQNDPRPVRTCFATLDLATGVLNHTSYLTLSQIASRTDGSYEYLDQSVRSRTDAGSRVVYRLKRDGGVVSISDDASQGFAFQGHDERLLIFHTQQGTLSTTPPLTGTGTMDKVYLVGTTNGIIAWGGHKPKSDGTEESFSDGMILDWPP